MSEHVTEAANEIEPVAEAAPDEAETEPASLPGPSTNPATNLIIADIVVRGVTRMVRDSMHKGVLRTRYSRDKAKDIVDNQSLMHTIAIYGITKVATRSVPGALLIGGGLIAKTLYDRGKSRNAAKRRSASQIKKMVDEK